MIIYYNIFKISGLLYKSLLLIEYLIEYFNMLWRYVMRVWFVAAVSGDLSGISSIFNKPSAYVELLVDGVHQKKTQHVKHNAHPKWQETFTV